MGESRRAFVFDRINWDGQGMPFLALEAWERHFFVELLVLFGSSSRL